MFIKSLKFIHLILLLSTFLSSNISLASPALGENMKKSVIEFAITEHKKIKEDHSLKPQEQLYLLSMPLLAMATLKETKDFDEIFADMEQILSDESTISQIEKPWELWMMGRMAVAAKLANDTEKLKQIKEKLSTKLFENNNDDDVKTGWAFAYFASLDEESYQKCSEKLFKYKEFEKAYYIQNPNKEASNYVWTLVMNMYASANANKEEDFVGFLTDLKELTEKKTLEETNLLVPESDYRQWLVSLERYSCAIMKNTLDEPQAMNSPTVDSFDSMLGWANTLTMPASTVKNAEDPNRFYPVEKSTSVEQSEVTTLQLGDFRNNM